MVCSENLRPPEIGEKGQAYMRLDHRKLLVIEDVKLLGVRLNTAAATCGHIPSRPMSSHHLPTH